MLTFIFKAGSFGLCALETPSNGKCNGLSPAGIRAGLRLKLFLRFPQLFFLWINSGFQQIASPFSLKMVWVNFFFVHIYFPLFRWKCKIVYIFLWFPGPVEMRFAACFVLTSSGSAETSMSSKPFTLWKLLQLRLLSRWIPIQNLFSVCFFKFLLGNFMFDRISFAKFWVDHL